MNKHILIIIVAVLSGSYTYAIRFKKTPYYEEWQKLSRPERALHFPFVTERGKWAINNQKIRRQEAEIAIQAALPFMMPDGKTPNLAYKKKKSRNRAASVPAESSTTKMPQPKRPKSAPNLNN